MPQEITQERSVKNLRKGDVIRHNNQELHVMHVEHKRTRSAITVAERTAPLYLDKDELILATRTEPTDEERAAQRVEFAIEDIAQKITRMHKSSPAADLAAKLIEDAGKGYRSPAFVVLKWHAEKTIKAETECELWLAIEVVQTNRESTLAEAFVIWYEETLRTAAFGFPGDTYSGRVTNDLIRLQNETRVEWLRDNEYTYNALAGRTITVRGQ